MRPNLIYIFADQLCWNALSIHGNKYVSTPNIDKLASESVEFCNAVSGHPVCAPYRASLFTGKYTTSTGMVINELRMNTKHKCFAHILSDNGYETCYIGKWHLYANEYGNHNNAKNSFVPQGPDRLGFDDYFAAYNFHHEYYGEKAYYHLNTPEKIYCEKYEPDEQTNLAITQLNRLAEKKQEFALFLSFGTPHDPWEPENVPEKYYNKFKDAEIELPENFSTKEDAYADGWARLKEQEFGEIKNWLKVYYAMIENLDDNINRLMLELERLSLIDNSIIVFTSDHGEMFGAHGRRAKNIFYDEAVRVPFFLRSPELLAKKSDVCLNTVDIMPTILDMLQLPIPQSVEGQSVYNILSTNNEEEPEGSLMMGTGATAIWEDGHDWRAWRDKQYTYARYLSDGKEFLFDNKNDPYQRSNLSGLPEYAKIKENLSIKMKNKMDEIKDEFYPSSYYGENWITDRVIKRTATLKDDL